MFCNMKDTGGASLQPQKLKILESSVFYFFNLKEVRFFLSRVWLGLHQAENPWTNDSDKKFLCANMNLFSSLFPVENI